MSTTRAALTDEDIRTLVKGATADERAVAAHKLCRAIERAELKPEERERAHDILRVMCRDAEELVRRAVAVTLKNSPAVPRDVALRLARDIETVSLPMISFSPAFTDDDLAEIVRLGGPVRQVAVAKRPSLSRAVTEVIAEVGVERAVEAACSNDNADFAEAGLRKVVERFETSERILAAVAYRQVLPPAVTEKLIDLVSDQVLDHLVTAHALSPDTALKIALGAKERATIDLVDQAGRTPDVKAFVVHLNRNQRLTASLLLRALAHGHMNFFEWGLAELSGVPHHRTWLMIHDAGPLGLKAIYERAGLPARLLPAFRAAVEAYHSMEYDGEARDRERFQERLLQRFVTQAKQVCREDLDYLLDKIDRIAGDARLPASRTKSA